MAGVEKFDLTTEEPVNRSKSRFWWFVALGIFAAVVIFFVGFVIGYFAMKARASESPESPKCPSKGKIEESDYKQFHERMVNSLTAENVEEFSR